MGSQTTHIGTEVVQIGRSFDTSCVLFDRWMVRAAFVYYIGLGISLTIHGLVNLGTNDLLTFLNSTFFHRETIRLLSTVSASPLRLLQPHRSSFQRHPTLPWNKLYCYSSPYVLGTDTLRYNCWDIAGAEISSPSPASTLIAKCIWINRTCVDSWRIQGRVQMSYPKPTTLVNASGIGRPRSSSDERLVARLLTRSPPTQIACTVVLGPPTVVTTKPIASAELR
ncbi:hypothetical protein B0O80DRAFT_277021 [Mortierella sp. GBAus27b]|nr:hypothetical protein B0O80DRAFT_277021 [Mortierella sp. GBAus27b]